MANRSPLSGPSFTVTPNNPQALEGHQFWGQYNYVAGPVTVGSDPGANQLPNEPGNVLSNPEFGKLEVGDLATTTDAANANRGVWFCVLPGTAGGGDAIWRRLDNATSAVQTIRDAHVIVVGQTPSATPTGLQTLAGLASPPLSANGLNLGGVGEQLSITVDYLDPGNCTQFDLALQAAAAAGQAIDIRLRPVSLSLDAVGAPATLTNLAASCRLIGAGASVSTLFSRSTVAGAQRILTIDTSAEVIDVGFSSPSPTAPNAAGFDALLKTAGPGCRVDGCYFQIDGATRFAAGPAASIAFWDPSATALVTQCEFAGTSQTPANTLSTALIMGDPTSANKAASNYREWDVSDCDFLSSGGDTLGWNQILWSYNVQNGGLFHDSSGKGVSRPQSGMIRAEFAGTPALTNAIFPRFDNLRFVISDGNVADAGGYDGILFTMSVDNTTAADLQATNCTIAMPTTAVPRRAYRVLATGTAAAIEIGLLSGLRAVQHTDGVTLETGGLSGSISSVRIDACIAKSPTASGGTGHGIYLKDGTLGNTPSIDACGVVNCNAINAPATTFGLEITTKVRNTTVGFNNFTPNGGTAYLDGSGTSEAAHNILA